MDIIDVKPYTYPYNHVVVYKNDNSVCFITENSKQKNKDCVSCSELKKLMLSQISASSMPTHFLFLQEQYNKYCKKIMI